MFTHEQQFTLQGIQPLNPVHYHYSSPQNATKQINLVRYQNFKTSIHTAHYFNTNCGQAFYTLLQLETLEASRNKCKHISTFPGRNKGTEGSRSLAIFSPINIDHSSRVQERSVLTMPLIQNAEKINNSGFLCSKGTLGPIHINTLGEYPYM